MALFFNPGWGIHQERKERMSEAVMSLVELNKRMADLVDRLYALLIRYVPLEELDQAGILKEIHTVAASLESVGKGGDSDDD